MATTITKPPMLDSTGRALISAINTVSIKPNIVNNLTTQDATKALSANMGYVLNNDKVSKSTTGAQTMAGSLSLPSITASGMIQANSFNATSSRKLKKEIKPTLVSALDLIDSVEVVDFIYKNDENEIPHIGFIAEDTDSLLSTPSHDKIDYTNCIGVLIKAVQELSEKVRALESKINGEK